MGGGGSGGMGEGGRRNVRTVQSEAEAVVDVRGVSEGGIITTVVVGRVEGRAGGDGGESVGESMGGVDGRELEGGVWSAGEGAGCLWLSVVLQLCEGRRVSSLYYMLIINPKNIRIIY